MIRRGSLAIVLGTSLAAPLAAQDGATPPFDMPRSTALFAGQAGWETLDAERFGTPEVPKINELGMFLVQRMFRAVCTGIEAGKTPEEVLPEGFSGYNDFDYLMALPGEARAGRDVYSLTGSEETDEIETHPAFHLREGVTGVTCALVWWLPDDIPEDRQAPMASMIAQWMPYEMSLVRVTKPDLGNAAPPSHHLEWDRPCGDAWCPVSATYIMRGGPMRLETLLNIKKIAGGTP